MLSMPYRTESHALRGSSSRVPQTLLRIVVLTVLFTAVAVNVPRQLNYFSGSEVWIHLRTGVWILQNHAVPSNGIFSQYTDLSWKDSSWGFDLLLGVAYRLVGLRAILMAAILLKAALAIAAFRLARAGKSGFWESVVLSAAAQYVIDGLQTLSGLCSVVFLAIELTILIRSRQGGDARSLFWLPVLFVLWANLHAQFVVGLVVLFLFAILEFAARRLRSCGVSWISSRIVLSDPVHAGWAVLLSFAATLANPYAYRLFPVAVKTAYSSAQFKYFSEMFALSFRKPQDYVLMLLIMMAFLSLGRLRSLELFELGLLLVGTVVAFRIQRDNWLAVLPAIALLSSGISWLPEQTESRGSRSTIWLWAAGLSVAVIVAGIISLPGDEELIRRAGKTMPVKACDYIRAHHLHGPIFNAFSFGSFLPWYLPEYPAAIDTRVELYGNKRVDDYFEAISGNRRIEDAPVLAQAGTLLLEKESGLGLALTTFPVLEARYQQVYSDDVARVFVTLPTPAPEK